jgi:hypothetical protein
MPTALPVERSFSVKWLPVQASFESDFVIGQYCQFELFLLVSVAHNPPRTAITELAGAGKVTQESVSTAKLFPRINRLYDRGRLQDAVGQGNAENLLSHVDQSHLAKEKIANRLALAKTAAKIVLGSGIGGIGYELLK